MKQRSLSERQFQLLWGLLHLSAAWLAATAVAMHIGSAMYHLRRVNGKAT